MSPAADFDALVAAAKVSGDPRDLWRAWYELDAHWVLARPRGPMGTPYLGEIDGAGWVFAFTDAEHLRECGRAVLGLEPHDDVLGLKMPMPGAVDWLVSLQAHGVAGVRVNQGENGFFAPLRNLVPMRDHYAAEAGRHS